MLADSPFGKKYSLPTSALRLSLKIGGLILPGLTSLIVYRIWFKTRHYPVPLRERQWLKTAREFVLMQGTLPVTLYEWGEGPLVLLVHGWSGRGLQLGGIGRSLAEAGYRAVAIDLPGHGKTPGNKTTVFEMADTISEVARYYAGNVDSAAGSDIRSGNDISDEPDNHYSTPGTTRENNIHAIVTHSFGAVTTLYLLPLELKATRVVCVNPPDTMDLLFGMFARYLQLSPALKSRVVARIENRFGPTLWDDISPLSNARRLNESGPGVAPEKALVVHDEDDREVEIEHGAVLAESWAAARLQRTSGLGHRRILRDNKTIQSIVDFIAE